MKRPGPNLSVALLVLATVVLVAAPAIAVTPRILLATGRVLLKRNGWSSYHPTSAGTALYSDDLLQPDLGVKVIVICPNLTKWRVPAGEPSSLNEGCQGPGILIRPNSLAITTTYGGSNSLIPYIVSPRSTSVLTDKPILRWNAVPGVANYTVKLSSQNGVIWSQKVSGTQVVYPGTPPLKPGVAYSLLVEAANGKSSQDEGTTGLQFNLLDQQQVQQVRDSVEGLDKQGLPDEVKALYLVDLYRERKFNLIAEAIATLEALVVKSNKTPIFYRTLGDLYWQVGLKLLAEAHYLKAIELAKSPQDLEERAAAEFGLGNLYTAIGDRSEASRWLKQAMTEYKVLGDTKRINDLERRLDRLKATFLCTPT